jgi:hypothetical protein
VVRAAILDREIAAAHVLRSVSYDPKARHLHLFRRLTETYTHPRRIRGR